MGVEEKYTWKYLHQLHDKTYFATVLFTLVQKSYVSNHTWTKEQFMTDLSMPTAFYVCLFKEEQMIGFSNAHLVLDEVEIMNVAVLPNYQTQGLGKKILELLLTEMKSKGGKQFFLEVRAQNLPAIHLYQKIGFQQISIRKNYYKNPQEDGIIMTLR